MITPKYMSNTGKPSAANLYNPHEQSREQLIGRFVVRQNVFHEVFCMLKTTAMTPPVQHLLIEGQRGMGKTTLLLRLSYEVANDSDFASWLIPIVLKEEAYYGIRRLFNLWEKIAEELEQKQPEFAGLHQQMSAAYTESSSYETICFELLEHALETQSRKLILFIDNFGEFLRNFTLWEQLRFCQILGNSPLIRIVAASAVALEAFAREAEPLAPLFQRVQLEGLNREETHQLLLELGKGSEHESTIRHILNRQPGRVESLRLLTGGVIRTIVLLFEIFTDQEDSSTLADLDTVLDRVTPLYKSRMDDLTPLQREVVHTIALGWEAMSVEEIANKARLQVEEVVSVLQQLTHVFMMEQVSSDTKTPLYRLKERFFNVWYLMRLTSGTSQARVIWLVHFLENWYSPKELAQHVQRHIQAMSDGEYQAKAALYLTEAFARSGQLDMDTEHKMIAATRRLLEATDVPLATELSRSDKELLNEGDALYQQERFDDALAKYLQVKRKNANIQFRIGFAYMRTGRYAEAEAALLSSMRGGHADAVLQLGHLYAKHLNIPEKAVTYYTKGVEKGRPDAMLHLGNLYHQAFSAFAQAEQYYLMAIKEAQVRAKVLRSGSFSLKGLKNYLVTAIKGDAEDPERSQFQDFSGTKDDFLELIEQSEREAMFQLGNLYASDQKRLTQAETYYAMAADAGHIGAMTTFGEFAQTVLKDMNKAEKYYLMAAERGDIPSMVNLALLYHDVLKNNAQAEVYYSMAAERGDLLAMNGLAWLYFEEHRQKTRSLEYILPVIQAVKNRYTAHTAACIYLWNNQSDRAAELAELFIYDTDAYKTMEQDILLYLLLLLAKQEYQTAWDYFCNADVELRKRFAPLYYALLTLGEHEDAQKCPPELAQPVNEILRRVERMAREYA
ncbi:ATPase [Candidatus Moduliflexus flocculans]|uniref:ATPase n=1 Tax=Candidatus Moduliflexus flocculans TaxID=1499966 RepID=A0A0S6W442_9BACT|nr:ATPase [Candidatus Moduliflexus flocculans]